MTDSQDILFNVTGQTLCFDAPEGRPSSVTSVQVFEASDADTATAESAVGSPSVESFNTTFSAASGAGETDPTKLHLTTVTALVRGRQYLATNAYGDREWVEVARIDSTNVKAYARTNLLTDYASTDTFQSTRMTATVDSTWVADRNNLSPPLNPRPRYRVVWTYVVSSVTYRHAAWFDLVRYPFSHTVTAQDVDRLSRGWLYRLAGEDRLSAGEAVIAEAVQQVKVDLWERELADYAFRNQPALNELIRRKAVALVSEQAYQHGGVALPVMEHDRELYWQRFEALIGQPKIDQQVSADGASGTPQRADIFVR